MVVNNDEVSGKSFGFWESGMTIYAAVVVIVNFVLLRLFNNWTTVGMIFIFFSVVSFWFSMWFLSFFKWSTVLYRSWEEFLMSAPAWFGLIYVSS
jgi:hypothetical protein